MKGSTFARFLPLAFLIFLFPLRLQAQILSGISDVALSATMTESLSVTLTGANSVSFTLTPGGVAAGNTGVPIETSWVLKPNRTAVTLVGYFDIPANALTNAGPPLTYLTSSLVLGQVTGTGPGRTTTFTAFNQTITGIGPAGGSLQLFSEPIGGSNKVNTRDDTLALEIDLSSVPQQAAGDYTGILHIRAIAP
ncbi:MAG: hypothetical protein LAN62_15160 [Acidobacteriia bacterium]|nr:hypothetical protein [Terriglobia bacterium]